jgi:pantetheine-phosphate adenylyltransferase
MNNALYPGSFDPLTFGHLDIIERASKLFDYLYIGIINNINKKGLFTLEERQAFMIEATKHLPNVKVMSFDGLSVAAAKTCDANVLIRGLRAISDFEYELQLAATNLHIAQDIETLFLMARTEYSYVSSTLVKELALYDADVSGYTTELVAKALQEKYRKEKDDE